MSDQMFEFDTSKERQQVEAFDKALDRLTSTVNKLDKTSLERLTQTFKELEASGSRNSQNLANATRKSFKEIEDQYKQLEAIAKKGFVNVSDAAAFNKVANDIKNGLADMANRAEMARREIDALNKRAEKDKWKQYFSNWTEGITRSSAGTKEASDRLKEYLQGTAKIENSGWLQYFRSWEEGIVRSSSATKDASDRLKEYMTQAAGLDAGKWKQYFKSWEEGIVRSSSATKDASDRLKEYMTQAAGLDAGKWKQYFKSWEEGIVRSSSATKDASDRLKEYMTQAAGLDAGKWKQYFKSWEEGIVRSSSATKDASDRLKEYMTQATGLDAGKWKQYFKSWEEGIVRSSSATKDASDRLKEYMTQAAGLDAGKWKQYFNSWEEGITRSNRATKAASDQLKEYMLQASRLESMQSKDFFKQLGSGNTGWTSGPLAAIRPDKPTYSARDSFAVFDAENLIPKKTKEVTKFSEALRKLTVDGNDVHSMTRGLASGFNLLWLTWGNLGPLFIGAAISNGFMQTAKSGMEVAHTLQVISSLGKGAGDSMATVEENTKKLSAAMLELGNASIFGPKELAEAMQVLTLAGLKTNETLAALGPTLNLAIAGTTDLKTAADVLVSMTTAFGTGAAGFREASDIIVRAAAESKASVESIGEAIKLASVAGEQYGATMTDVASMVALVSNLGIQGTAAGTAIRNMFADMSERTPKSAAAMKQLGVDFRDANGNLKPLLTNIQDLDRSLKQFDGRGAKNAIRDIFTERGEKGAIAALVAYRQAIVDADGVTQEWSESNNRLTQILDSVKKSAGDSAIAAAEMSESTKNSFKAIGATIQTTMYKAYQELEPTLYMVSVRLREAFSSPEAVAGIKALINSIASLTVAIVDNIGTITKLAVAYAAFKTASMTLSSVINVTKGASLALVSMFPTITQGASTAAKSITALAEAKDKDRVASIASAAASKASIAGDVAKVGILTRLAGVLPVVGNLITLASLGWAGYEFFANRANKESKDYAETKSDKIIEALEKEAEKLKFVNDERLKGLSLMEAEAKFAARLNKAVVVEEGTSAVNKAKLEEASALERLDKAKRTARAAVTAGNKASLESAIASVNAAQLEVDNAGKRVEDEIRKAAQNTTRLEEQQERVRKLSQESVDITLREAKAQKDAFNSLFSGDKEYKSTGGPVGGAGNYVEGVRAAIDNTTKIIEKGMDRQLKVAESGAQRYRATLEAQYKAGELSAGEYNAKIVSLEISTQDTKTSILKSARAEANAAFDADISAAKAALAQAQKSGKSDLIKNAEARLRSLDNLQGEFNEKLQDQLNIAEDTRFQTLRKNLADARGEFKKLLDDDDKFWKKDSEEIDKAKALADVEERYRNINESIFSSARAEMEAEKARTEAMETYKAELRSLEERYADAQVAAQSFYDEQMAIKDSNESFSPEVLNYYNGLLDIAKEIQDRILLRKGDAAGNALDKANLAFDKVMRDNAASLTNALSDAVETGLLQGGKAGGAKLKGFLKAEFKKLVLTPTIKALLAPLSGALVGLISGGASAATGGGTNLMGMASNASSAYNLISSGFNVASQAGTWLASKGANYLLDMGAEAASEMLGQFGAGMMNTASWGAASQAALAGGAQLAGVVAGSLLNGFSGYGISKMLSGGYSAGSWVNYAAAIASAIPGVGPIAGVVGGIVNRAFGRKHEQTNLQGTFGGDSGFEGQWEDYYKGGWLRSGKSVYTPLEEETRSALADQFNAMRVATAAMANVLGSGADAIADFTAKVNIKLKGLSPEEAEKAIQAEMDKVAEALAKAQLDAMGRALMVDYRQIDRDIIGGYDESTLGQLEKDIAGWKQVLATGIRENGEVANKWVLNWVRDAIAKGEAEISKLSEEMWKPFAKAGETAVETLTRLSGNLASVNDAFSSLGNTLYAASLQGADTASKLADLFGGVEGFNQATSSYFSNFYSQEEQRNDAQRRLELAFASVGQVLPDIDASDAREQFRAIVSAQDLTTESGRKTWATLIQVSEAFANLTPIVEETSDAISEDMQNLAARVTEAFNAMNQAGSLLDRIDAALGGSGNGYSQIREQRLWAAMSEASYEQQIELAGQLTDIVLSRYQVESEASQKQLDFARSLRDYVESLKIGSLSPLTNAQKLAEASKQYASTLDKARAGDEKAMGSLQGAASSYLELARVYFASSEDYTSIFNNVTGALDSLGVTSQSDAERQLSVSSDSLRELTKLRDILEGAYASAEADYTIQKTLLQEQIDYASRTAAGVESIVQVLGNLPAEIAASIGGGNNYFAQNPDVFAAYQEDSYGMTAEEFALTHYMKYGRYEQRQAPYSASYVPELTGGIINGSHANGLDYVPFDGYIAQLHKGERVLTERENISYSRGSYRDDSTAELVAEVRSLRAEVSALRRENREDSQMVTRATVASSQENAAIIVNGVGEATSRAAYAKTLESKATLR